MPSTSLSEKSTLARAFFAEVTLKYGRWLAGRAFFKAPANASAEHLARGEFPPAPLSVHLPQGIQETPAPLVPGLWEAVEQYGDLTLSGPPGAGKTTELWRLAETCASRPPLPDSRLPVLIELAHYDGRSSFRDFVRAELERGSRLDLSGETFPAHAEIASRLDEYLADGLLLLLFDGLDEMPRRTAADSAYRLAVFRDRHRNNRFVLASRPEVLTLWQDLPSVEIGDLDRQAQARLLHFLRDQAGSPAPPLTPEQLPAWLPRYPLYLVLFSAAGGGGDSHPPSNLAALLDRFTRHAWESACEQPELALEYDEVWPRLARLAAATLNERGSGTSAPREWAMALLQGESDEDRGRSTAWLAREAGLLRQDNGGLARFAHVLFQDYFAALELRRLGIDDPFVKQAVRFRHWEEALVLWASMDRPSRLIRSVLPLDPFLAARLASDGGALPAATWNLVRTRLAEKADSRFVSERLQALQAMAEAGLPEAPARILESVRKEDLHTQAALRKILARIPAETLFPALSPLFKDKDGWMRAWVVELAGELALRPALVHLVRLSEDPDPRVRVEVARALPRLAGTGAISYLGTLLRDSNHLVRQAAAQSMLGFGVQALVGPFSQPRADGDRAGGPRTEAVSRLISLLKDNIREVRWVASEILSEWPAGQTLPALTALLGDTNKNIRWLAARVLARRQDSSALPALRTWLSSQDPEERAVAVECLARFPGEVAHELGAALADVHWHVRAAAILELERLHDPDTLPLLLTALQDSDPYIRSLSARVLVELQAPAAIPHLIQALRDENPAVRQSAAQLLGRLRSGEAISPLVQLLQDEAGPVRGAAAQALGEIRQERVASDLVPLLGDEEQMVRASAKRALGKVGGEATLEYLMTLGDEVTSLPLAALRGLYDPESSRAAESAAFAIAVEPAEPSGAITPGRPASFIGRFVDQLGHADPEVRADAEKTLKLHARVSHLGLIVPLLDSPDARLSNAAFDIILAVRRRFDLAKDYTV